MDAALFERRVERVLNTALVNRLGRFGQVDVVLALRWKEPHWIAMGFPALAQHLQSALGQRYIPVFASLAQTHVNHHSGAVDIGDLKTVSLLKPQAARVDSR